MIIAYTLTEGKKPTIKKVDLTIEQAIPKNTIWIDLLEPSIEEEKAISKALKIDTPTREEMDKMEVLSPFYKEDNAYFMTITVIQKADKEYPEGTAISFIMHPQCLITLRHSKPRAFNYFATRAAKDASICSSPDIVLEGLLEGLIHTLGDTLEKTGNEIDQLLVDIFDKPDVVSTNKDKQWKPKSADDEDLEQMGSNYFNYIIKRVGRTGNRISKMRESLVSIHRMMIFFGQIEEGKFMSRKESRIRFRNLAREVHSLTEYANFLSQRNSFLLDATLGMINVEQNMIIKVFTVAAAVFLPPTLIASIYGMNFAIMPELNWSFGYPFSLFLMLISALLPYFYFKKKGLL